MFLHSWHVCACQREGTNRTCLCPRLCYNPPVDPGHAAVTRNDARQRLRRRQARPPPAARSKATPIHRHRLEEHTSELQSHLNLVCRLLLEKKNISTPYTQYQTI